MATTNGISSLLSFLNVSELNLRNNARNRQIPVSIIEYPLAEDEDVLEIPQILPTLDFEAIDAEAAMDYENELNDPDLDHSFPNYDPSYTDPFEDETEFRDYYGNYLYAWPFDGIPIDLDSFPVWAIQTYPWFTPDYVNPSDFDESHFFPFTDELFNQRSMNYMSAHQVDDYDWIKTIAHIPARYVISDAPETMAIPVTRSRLYPDRPSPFTFLETPQPVGAFNRDFDSSRYEETCVGYLLSDFSCYPENPVLVNLKEYPDDVYIACKEIDGVLKYYYVLVSFNPRVWPAILVCGSQRVRVQNWLNRTACDLGEGAFVSPRVVDLDLGKFVDVPEMLDLDIDDQTQSQNQLIRIYSQIPQPDPDPPSTVSCCLQIADEPPTEKEAARTQQSRKWIRDMNRSIQRKIIREQRKKNCVKANLHLFENTASTVAVAAVDQLAERANLSELSSDAAETLSETKSAMANLNDAVTEARSFMNTLKGFFDNFLGNITDCVDTVKEKVDQCTTCILELIAIFAKAVIARPKNMLAYVLLEIGQLMLRYGGDSLWEKAKAYFNRPKTQGLEEFTSYGNLAKWIGGALACLLGGMICTTRTQKGITTLMRDISAVSLTVKAAKDLSSAFPRIYDKIRNWINGLCGFETEEEASRYLELYENWSKKLKEVWNRTDDGESVLQRVNTDRDLVKTYEALYRQIDDIQSYLVRSKAELSVLRSFQFLASHVTYVYKNCQSSLAFAGTPRTEPVCIWLHGATGQGKSYLSMPLAVELAKRLGPHTAPKEVMADVFTRNIETEFWNGYKGQTVVLYDDFGQMKDSASQPNLEYLEIIKCVNIAPYPLRMAHLPDKGMHFSSKAVFLTSNLANFNINSITHKDAFYRRIDFGIHVSVKKEYSITINGTPQVDRSKVPKTEGICTNIYDFKCTHGELAKLEMAKLGINPNDMTYQDILTMVDILGNRKFQDTQVYLDKIQHSVFVEDSTAPNRVEEAPSETPEATGSDEVSAVLHIQGDRCQCLEGNLSHEKALIVKFLSQLESTGESLESYVKDRTDPLTQDNPMDYHVKLHFPLLGVEAGTVCFPALMMALTNFFPEVAMDVLKCSAVEKPKEKSSKIQYLKSMLERVAEHFKSSLAKVLDFIKKDWRMRILQVLGLVLTLMSTFSIWKYFTTPDEVVKITPYELYLASAVYVQNMDQLVKYVIAGASGVVCLTRKLWAHCEPTIRELCVRLGTTVRLCFRDDTKQVTRLERDLEELEEFGKKALPAVSEAFASGDARTRARPTPKVEALIDKSSQCLISSKVRSNLYHLTAERADGSLRPLLHGLFVRGQCMLVPKHVVLGLENAVKIIMVNATGEQFKVKLCDIRHTPVKNARGEELEATLWIFPTYIKSHSDLVKHFCNRQTKEMADGARVTMPTLVSRGNFEYFFQILGNTSVKVIDKELTIRDDEKSTTAIVRGYCQYSLNTQQGDCGCPVIAQETSIERKIFGIHVAGTPTGECYAQFVSADDLNRSLEDVDIKHRILLDTENLPYVVDGSLQSDGDKTTEELCSDLGLPGTNFWYCGNTTRPIFSPNKTKLRPSVVHGKIVEPTTKPAILYNRGGVNVKHQNLRKCGTVTPDITGKDLDSAVQNVRSVLLSGKDLRLARLLTYEETVTGVEGEEYLGPVNRSTSPGYPWLLFKQSHTKGKQGWLGSDENYRLDEEVMRAMQAREEAARKGIRIPVVWVDTLKDERRPVEKVDALKTRVFSAGPMDYTLLVRRYFLGFMAHVMRNRIWNEQSIGTNVYGPDWSVTAVKLGMKGKHVVAGDFSTFDGTLNTAILERFSDVVSDWYGDGDENRLIRRVLMQDVYNSIHLCDGVYYGMNHSQPSGNPLTTVLNSFYNSVSVRMVYLMCARHADLTVGIQNFGEDVSMVSYGDDNVLNISERIIGWFNQETISREFANIGMIYTDETKTGAIVPKTRRLEEILYLKRRFEYRDGVWLAPLELTTLLEETNWIRGDIDRVGCSKLNCEIACMELGMYPIEVFTEWTKAIEDAFFQETGVALSIRTYWDYAFERGFYWLG
uniref:RNA-directed RNA polymerase n=1 Tax=Periplaneta americana dicistrovirus TaxID=3032227 RepID=A0AAT9JFN1_9VIRU